MTGLKLDHPSQKVPYSTIVEALKTASADEVAAQYGVSVAAVTRASSRAYTIERYAERAAARAVEKAKAKPPIKSRDKPHKTTRIISDHEMKVSAATKATQGVRKGLDLTRGVPLGYALPWEQRRWHYAFDYSSFKRRDTPLTGRFYLTLIYVDRTCRWAERGYNLDIEPAKGEGPRYQVHDDDPFALPAKLLAIIPETDRLHSILSNIIDKDAAIRGTHVKRPPDERLCPDAADRCCCT